MSARSGEMARRAALGVGASRNGGQVAAALQTIRYSVLDKRRGDLTAKRSALLSKRKDQGHLLWALRHEAARLEGSRAEIVARLEKVGRSGRVEVTDHAVIRFLERAMGIDINAVRAQIERLIPSEALESDRVLYIRDGLAFLVGQRSLVTILDDYMDVEVDKAFAIDGAPIAPLRPVDPHESAASSAARTLNRRAKASRAKFEETTARLKAELGWAA